MPPKPPQPGPIDLNILPQHYRPRVVSPTIVLFWVIAIVLLVLTIPGFIVSQSNERKMTEIDAGMADARSTLAAIRTPAPEVYSLTRTLSDTTAMIDKAAALRPTLVAGQRDWEGIFGAIMAHDAQRVQVSALYQSEDTLTLQGLALTQSDVLAYASSLENSQVFSQVLVQSMREVEKPAGFGSIGGIGSLSDTIGITQTLSGQQLSSIPYDPYEVDDFEPYGIVPGEIQWRNFYPAYDGDQASFTGKAGRSYCILAVPQQVGTDPYLEVTIGGRTYASDDCHADGTVFSSCECPTGTITMSMASLIEVQVSSQVDEEIRIKVANHGEYGPQTWYGLQVYEPIGDRWEKDDAQSKPIAVGEAQVRSFYPTGDMDRVSFPVKAGRSYELRTTNLSVGVDTVISVYANGVAYYNDDDKTGNSASRVEFRATTDSTANAVISNNGLYGPTMAYTLQLLEVGGDQYEPNDYAPSHLSPWDQQRHTFYPEGDVDRLEFNVKAGRTYELKTYNLSVGVDTVASVVVGGMVYHNDDQAAGDPSSLIQFQATADGEALVTFTNREQYGADLEYWVTLSELADTPGSDGTPTPDCADEYEPDDIVPRLMVVGEEQPHSFCPTGDADRAVFTAKAGYSYQIETIDLATGADTVLSVQIGQNTYSSDDRGGQDLSSMLRVQNTGTEDTSAFISVMNKGMFGANMTYMLKVTDIASGDPYETDNVTPVAIALGVPQDRTFYPAGDVDRVSFTAKVNHRYRIHTLNLAPLVDTVLSVEMGGAQLRNDDRTPGDLSSYVELQNSSSTDQQAIVTVFNNGSFSPDASYLLQVDDLGTEGSDGYEPDLTVKRYLSVGEVQRHTFHPNNDVDQVWVQVKAGRRYVIYTCGNPYQSGAVIAPTVAPVVTQTAAATVIPVPTTTPVEQTLDVCMPMVPGADTVLLATGPVQQCDPNGCQSDDAYPGTGFLNSRIEFTAVADGEVTITVYNKGLFGPGQFYYLLADEIGSGASIPASQTAPTATPTPAGTPESQALHRVTPNKWPALAAPLPQETAVITPTVTVQPTETVASDVPGQPGERVIEFILQLTMKGTGS
ncbi:MAG: PilN domain-containing protein [Anaerolineae bacterium]